MSANPIALVPDQTAHDDAAADALRLQEEQLRLAIDTVPALVSYVDSEQRYQFTNKGYEEWFGHSREEVCGKHLREILGKDAYENIRPHVEQALAGNKVSFASWLDYQGAGKRHVQVSYEPHLDEQGNVRGFLAFILDLTERKQVEEELRESKERFQRLVETTNAIAWEADLETWMFTYVSPQVTKLLGYECAEWYKKDFWIDHLHPEDRDFAVNFCTESSKHLTEYEFEYRMIAADGHTVWLRDLVSVVSGGNGQSSLRGYLIDITDRKKVEASLRNSEERLSNLLENIPDHVLILDRLGVICYVNHTAPGFSKEEVLGKHVSTFLQPESCALSEQSLNNAFRDGVTSEFELTDVNFRSYRIRYVPVKRDDEISSVLVVGTDITEQKQIEKSRRHLAERLEFAREDERRSLARHLHDEACQDLSAAAIYLEQLGLKLSRLLPEDVALQRDLVKVDNLIQLTHETLRRTARALHPSILEHYGLVTALRSFTQELSRLTQRSGVVFEMEVAPDFPRIPRTLKTTAYRIAQEAITNAFKHAQARKISVKLSLKDDVASIVVADDGCGIDYGAIKESHGIGLAAMQERAELIGAKIDISTKVNEGTTLALQIPLTGTMPIRDFTADSRQDEFSRCCTDEHNDSFSG